MVGRMYVILIGSLNWGLQFRSRSWGSSDQEIHSVYLGSSLT
jgi:hypothetical protein